MIALIAAALIGGLVSAAILIPLNPLMALIGVPLASSGMAALAGLGLLWRRRRRAPRRGARLAGEAALARKRAG